MTKCKNKILRHRPWGKYPVYRIPYFMVEITER